jgi:hypothetical protein
VETAWEMGCWKTKKHMVYKIRLVVI